MFCASSVLLKQCLLKIRKLALIKYDTVGRLEKKNQSHHASSMQRAAVGRVGPAAVGMSVLRWSSYTLKLLASAFRSVA